MGLLTRLIGEIGGANLIVELQRVVARIAGVERSAIFVYDPDLKPRYIFGAEKCGRLIDAKEGVPYFKRFYRMDPLRGELKKKSAEYFYNIDSSELPSSDYRDAYSKTGLTQRLSQIGRVHDTHAYAFQMYKSAPFKSAEIENIAKITPALAVIARRHCELAVSPAVKSVDECWNLLRAGPTRLAPQELAVCARILAGITLRDIADDLNVRESTVISYRKRAYARLGVSNQKELHRLCFAPWR